MLFNNGFKEAYAIKGGLRGKDGWQVCFSLLPGSIILGLRLIHCMDVQLIGICELIVFLRHLRFHGVFSTALFVTLLLTGICGLIFFLRHLRFHGVFSTALVVTHLLMDLFYDAS